MTLAPAVKVGRLKGNLKDGITSEFKVVGVTGALTLYTKEKRVFAKARVEAGGKKFETEVGIVTVA